MPFWAADLAAENGHLETLKWIRANGGEWTHFAADWAAGHGHLETLKWIRANGGEWTHRAAHFATISGHLETLKWILANGGWWGKYMVSLAARHGHFEVLRWLKDNHAPIRHDCPREISDDMLDYCIRIDIKWDDNSQVHLELDHVHNKDISNDLRNMIRGYVNLLKN